MLFPVVITRSILVVGVRKNTEKVSCSFIARFTDGTERIKNITTWQVKGIRKECETGADNIAFMSPETCTLYYKDWSHMPIFGVLKTAC
jgi:hypothetical protein